ncbi:conjugal transfer protein TraX [Paenibacillus sp. J5C_2022]|uniref:conjugal transfer protein TraX n=1 Tax=Paenibacillus sp. J5C2022 TaxID=2977129 RepID=UPI0021D34A23|nr:conjugal transfer protein TraX [Paenibacillus sp. J5C2022]MCU6712787.1 conjugal transfer protein TraX [Paenibacillus sp. J5C2022]
MQFLAMLTMLIDHIGAVWHPGDPLWRIIGRLAMPLYIYAMVIGYKRTRNMSRYFLRVGLLALLSQLPYQWAFHITQINVIATLFVCLLVLRLLDRYKDSPALQLLIAGAALIPLDALPFDYGGYALLLMLIYRYAPASLALLMHAGLELLAILTGGVSLQLFSLLGTGLIFHMPQVLARMDRIRMPRWIWRSFYPAHLAVIAALQQLI